MQVEVVIEEKNDGDKLRDLLQQALVSTCHLKAVILICIYMLD